MKEEHTAIIIHVILVDHSCSKMHLKFLVSQQKIHLTCLKISRGMKMIDSLWSFPFSVVIWLEDS